TAQWTSSQQPQNIWGRCRPHHPPCPRTRVGMLAFHPAAAATGDGVDRPAPETARPVSGAAVPDRLPIRGVSMSILHRAHPVGRTDRASLRVRGGVHFGVRTGVLLEPDTQTDLHRGMALLASAGVSGGRRIPTDPCLGIPPRGTKTYSGHRL